MSDERAYLLIVEGYKPSVGLITLYFSTHGFTSSPTDSIPNTFFEPRIKNPALYGQSMYAIGTTGGSSTGGYGNIELINNDGELDELKTWGFDSRTCTLYEGSVSGTFADFGAVLSGTIEQVEHNWSTIIFRFKDRTVELDTPVQPTKYLGNNVLPAGLEGTADLLGKSKPRMFGDCFNITPVLVNTSKLIYQINNGAVFSISAVRDAGVPLPLGQSYVDSTIMLAATPVAGTYNICLSEGYIRLGSNSFGEITVDASAIAASIGQTIKALAVEKIGADSIVEQSIIDLDAALPATVKFQHYTGANEVTTKAVLDELCKCGIWWGFDNNGKFWAKQFSEPNANNPILYLTNDDILNIERVATNDSDRGVPVWRVVCRYARNNTIQTTVAGSVAAGVYDKEWKEAVYEDASIKTIHPLAAELIIDSAFTEYSDALAEATRQFNLRSVNRDRLRVSIPMKRGAALSYPKGGYWDDEAITEMVSPRSLHTSEIHNSYLYIVGGVGGASGSVIRLDLNNPTGSWDDTGVSDIPSARYAHASSIYNNYLYVIGGSGGGDAASVIRLDLNNPTGSWDDSGVSDLPYFINYHTSEIYNNYLYVIGGSSSSELSSVIRLDLNNPTGAWDNSGVSDLPSARNHHASVVHNNYLYVIGGLTSYVGLSSVIRLDLNNPTGVWETASVSDLPTARESHASVVHGEHLYVIGGTIDSTVTASVIRLDLNNPTGVWETASVSDLPDYRSSMTADIYLDSIYVAGGLVGVSEPNTWRLRTNDNPQDLAELNSIGRTSLLTMPRYGYDAGKPMRIIGTEQNHETRKITLELWG